MNVAGLMPRCPVPILNVPLTTGEQFVLSATPGEQFDLVVFYRGLHCPLCAKHLLELEELAPQFTARGVQLIAVSCDSKERARHMTEKVKSRELKIGYGLSLQSARQWGLYISAHRGKTSIGMEEPALFSEPGIFIVRADGTLYYGSVQTMPFARPQSHELLTAIDFAIDKDYPARGDYSTES